MENLNTPKTPKNLISNEDLRRLAAQLEPAELLELAARGDDNPIATLVRNAYLQALQDSKPQPDTKDQPDIPPLPEEAMLDLSIGKGASSWVDSYVEYAYKVSPMTPHLFHQSAGLFLGSMAIARRLVLPMAFGDVYPNLFVLWLATTTRFRKSTALKVARDLARDTFPFLQAAHDTTAEAFLADLAGQQPINLENLSELDRHNWEMERNYCAQRGWILDELSGLMAGTGRDYNAGLLESLLRFYDCDPLSTRSTIGRGRSVVRDAYLCLLGASTPAAMARHFNSPVMWANGWWPRFAILTPDQLPDWVEPIAQERPSALHEELLRLFHRLPSDHKWPAAPQSIRVGIEQDALDAWQKYNKAISYTLDTKDLHENLRGVYGRLPTQVLKIAIILAAFQWEDQPAPVICLSHLARAIEIAETWRASAHRAIGAATENEVNQLFDRILYQIAKREPVGATVRDIYKCMKDKRPVDVEAAVQEMVNLGMLEALSQSSVGRHTTRYRQVRE